MAFQLSPGINVSEIDLTTVVPAVATTEGATVGVFRWGPTDERILVTSQVDLVSRFGKPYTDTTASWTNHESFFTAANFLDYSDALYVTRVVSDDAAKSTETALGAFEAKYPGKLGDSIFVSVAGQDAFTITDGPGNISIEPSATEGTIEFTSSANNGLTEIQNTVTVGDVVTVQGQSLKIETVENLTSAFDANNDIYTYTADITFDKRFIAAETVDVGYNVRYAYYDAFDQQPTSNTHYNIIVIDEGGEITGVPGTVLEKWQNVSTEQGARSFDGATNNIVELLENQSNWIGCKSITSLTSATASYLRLTGGSDGDSEDAIAIGKLAQGWDLYKNSEEVDISLLIAGRPRGTALANYIIDNIAEYRKDAIAFITPDLSDTSAADIVEFTGTLTESTYAVVDSGYKYMYDKYNDIYRWVPLGADVAGTCARTDQERDSWFSPAGYNRGSIKNVIKLRHNPNKSERDLLYKNGINPVIVEQGVGAILFGDKTFKKTPSAFDRINVRRLFIVLEKAIAVAAKATLFEFNDEFTRAQFVNLVEPFLRDVQGRRGIYDYKVVCDGSNNTGEIIDRNEFIGDIYVKPARSINYIQLNFVAVRTGVDFTEIVG